LGTNLENEIIAFRDLKGSDWVDVHQYASQEIVCQYQPWGPNTEEESQSFVNQALIDSSKEPQSRFVFAIVHKKDASMIGCGEINIRDFQNKAGEISYIVNPAYWGKGIATDVARLLLDFGFKNLHLHRIFATCDPKNIGSSKVLEKCGMMFEGRIRHDLLMKDGWRDSLLYSMLEHEFEMV
jgi:RimJ/RimL family protein N-acetyltransferase